MLRDSRDQRSLTRCKTLLVPPGGGRHRDAPNAVVGLTRDIAAQLTVQLFLRSIVYIYLQISV